jgi:hypothetical protein
LSINSQKYQKALESHSFLIKSSKPVFIKIVFRCKKKADFQGEKPFVSAG